MRILLVTHYFSTHMGGIERVADSLAVRLARDHGCEIVWAASETDLRPNSTITNLRYLPAKTWNVIEKKFGVPLPVWSIAAIAGLWREIEHADAVHLHDITYLGNIFAWLFACLRGVPVIITQHVGSSPAWTSLIRILHTLANRTLGRLMLSTADRVVFISPAVRDEFASFCRFRAEPLYLPNGVDTSVFSPQGERSDDPRLVDARRTGKRIFLFVGRFIERKGLHIMHELATVMSDGFWIFAGHGPLDPEGWGLSNVLVVRGERGAGLARYYRAADLLVLPSVGEGFPLVVQEAMACGTPAIVGEETAAGCPEAQALMFVEKVGADDTAVRWRQRLSELCENPEQLREIRPRVASFAQEHWSWKKTAAAYAELFAGLSKSRKA